VTKLDPEQSVDPDSCTRPIDEGRAEVVSAPPRPEVSVIIPTYNRVARLGMVLAALATQTYDLRRFQVVVVSDGSTDGTDEYLRSKLPVDTVFVQQPNRGPAAARNQGVAVAAGEFVLFLDDDVVPDRRLIEEHVESHRRGGSGLVVIGPMLTPPGGALSPWIEWEQEMLYRQYNAMLAGEYAATPRQFYTGNASVERSAVLGVGGFDERYRRAEDIELAYRLESAGFRFEFNARALGHHHAERSFLSWLQNATDYGKVDVVLARDHGRAAVAGIIARGFQRRVTPVRWLTLACLRHRRIAAATRWFYRGAYAASGPLRQRTLRRLALSGMYNLAYYGGVCDELGGSSEFSRWVDVPPPEG
jgi:GT2 family glycosyltransferase